MGLTLVCFFPLDDVPLVCEVSTMHQALSQRWVLERCGSWAVGCRCRVEGRRGVRVLSGLTAGWLPQVDGVHNQRNS